MHEMRQTDQQNFLKVQCCGFSQSSVARGVSSRLANVPENEKRSHHLFLSLSPSESPSYTKMHTNTQTHNALLHEIITYTLTYVCNRCHSRETLYQPYPMQTPTAYHCSPWQVLRKDPPYQLHKKALGSTPTTYALHL